MDPRNERDRLWHCKKFSLATFLLVGTSLALHLNKHVHMILPNQHFTREGEAPAEPWRRRLGRSLALPLFFALSLLITYFSVLHSNAWAIEPSLPGFEAHAPFNEQVRWTKLESGVRIFVNARGELSKQPRRLVVFATPNGNSIEQTLGCQAGDGIDWHFHLRQNTHQLDACWVRR